MKTRLDKAVFERGLAGSRERARALILEGKVLVNRMPETKAGTFIEASAEITIRGMDIPYVSRGGLKLRTAFEHFGISLKGRTAMDVGASTGGFTDCMLEAGARKVYAIDVGYGQFDWRLRNDPRVVLLERTNIRYLERERIPEDVDFAAVDVSFISLRLVLPKVKEFLGPGGEVVALIKPQFEVGRSDVGKGGIVRVPEKREEAVRSLMEAVEAMGFVALGVIESPLKGQKGNVEYLMHARGR